MPKFLKYFVLIFTMILTMVLASAFTPTRMYEMISIASSQFGYKWGSNDFVTVWNLNNTNTIAFKPASGYIYDARIFWGDGSENVVTSYNASGMTHTYSQNGIYTVVVTGKFPSVSTYPNSYYNMVSVSNLGDVVWGSSGFRYAFFKCTNLLSVGASSSTMGGMISLEGMFYACNSVRHFDTSNWGPLTNLTSLSGTFYGASSLVDVDASNWGPLTKLTRLDDVCYNCFSLTNLDTSGWGPMPLLENIQGAFTGCHKLKQIDTSNWGPMPKLPSLTSVFYGCDSVETLDLSSWGPLTNVTSMNTTFRYCTSLVSLALGNIGPTPKLTGLYQTFMNCKSLRSIDLSSLGALTNFTSLQETFNGCTQLTNVNTAGWGSMPLLTTMSYMFYNCPNLAVFDTSNWGPLTNLVDMNTSFQSTALTELDTSSWGPLTKLKTLNFAFGNTKIKSIDTSNWGPMTNLTTMNNVFSGCYALTNGFFTTLPVSLSSANDAYRNCTNMVGDLATVDNYAITNMYLGLYNAKKIRYSKAGGSMSSNIAHRFYLNWEYGTLSSNEVNYLLADLDTSGATGGTLRCYGNANPTYDGLVAKTNLLGKGWTITW